MVFTLLCEAEELTMIKAPALSFPKTEQAKRSSSKSKGGRPGKMKIKFYDSNGL